MRPFRSPAVLPAFLSLIVFFGAASFAAQEPSLYKKAEESLASRDNARADFYVGRYLGLAANGRGAAQAEDDISKLYDAHPLEPSAFLSPEYDAGFLDWFEKAMRPLWGQPEERVRERYGTVEVRHVRSGKYFAAVTATPKVEAWFTTGESPRRLLLTAGSWAKNSRASLIAGEYAPGGSAVAFKPVELNAQPHLLQYVWPPEFDDLDGDGTPEIWVRYDLTWGNGFTQFLDVYKIEADRLELMKRFEGPNEGVARRTGKESVETARGFGTKGELSHFEYDAHHVETWEYKSGEFIKTAEKNVPHLLKDASWKKYFVESRPSSVSR